MAQDDIYPTSRLTAIAYAFLGVGFLLSAYRAWKIAEVEAKGPRRLSGPTVPGKIVRVLEDDGAGAPDGRVGNLANETLEDADKRTRGAITKVRTLTVFTIDQRVAEIRRLMLRDSEDPKIIEAARGVLTRQCGGEWCIVPKDYDAEAVALFDAVVDPSSPIAIRYTRDHPIVDVFTAPVKMLRLRGEDCDSLVSFLGALLLAAGAIPEMVTVQTKGADTWSHIFLRVPRDGSDGVSEVAASEADHYNYLYLDPSMPDKPAGWAPPGTQYVLATGRPAGIVVKARVWNVL